MRQVVVVVIDEHGERAIQRVIDRIRNIDGVAGVGEAGRESPTVDRKLTSALMDASTEANEAEANARFDERERRKLDTAD